MRRTLWIVPVILSVFALSGLYVARWAIVGGLARRVIERSIEQMVGNDLDISVGSIEGTIVRDIRVRDVTTERPARGGPIRSIAVADAHVTYHLADVFTVLAAVGVPVLRDMPAFESERTRERLGWLSESPVDPAAVTHHLAGALPLEITLAAEGSVRLALEPAGSTTRPGSTQPTFVAFALRAAASESEDPLVTIALSEISSPWWPTDEERALRIDLDASPGRLALRTPADGRSEGVSLSATLESTMHEGRPTIVASDAGLNVGPLGVLVVAGDSSAELSIRIPSFEGVRRIVGRFVDLPPVVPGELSVSARAERRVDDRAPGDLRPLADVLLSAPGDLLDLARLRLEADAADWRLWAVDLDRARADVAWEAGELTIGDLSLASGATELAVAGRAPVPLATRDAEAPAAVPSGGVTGSIGGTLVARDPPAVLATLVRLGVISPLPAGFAPGRRVEASFELSGDAARPRIAANAEVEGATVAGYDVDSARARAQLVGDEVRVPSFVISAGETTVRATATVQREGPSLARYEARASATGLEAKTGVVRDATLSVSGDASSVTVGEITTALELDNLRDAVSVRLVRPFDLEWDTDGITVSELVLTTDLGEITGRGSLSGGEVDAEVVAEGVPLAAALRLTGSGVDARTANGTISLRARVEGSPDAPEFRLALDGESLALEGSPVAARLAIAQSDGVLRVDELRVNAAEYGRISGVGTLPISVTRSGIEVTQSGDDRFVVSAEAARLFALLPIGGSSPWDRPPWSEAAVDLTARLEGNRVAGQVAISGLRSDAELTIAGIEPITEIGLDAAVSLEDDGRVGLEATMASGEHELASATGTLGGERAGLAAEIDLPLARLSHLVPEVSLLGGRATGSFDLNRDGANDSAFTGEVVVEEGLVKVSPTVPTLSSVNARATYADGAFVIEEVSALMGGAPVTASGRYGPDESGDSTFEVSVTGESVLLARSPDLRARADVDATWRSSEASTSVNGSAVVTDVLYTRPVELFSLGTGAASPNQEFTLFQIESDWARSVDLNLRVTADRSIVVRNNLYDGTLSADLTLGGTAAVPRPQGRLFASSGTIMFPTAELAVEQLEVLFPSDVSFAPELRLQAVTDVQGFEMAVTVDGQIPGVQVSIVSSPPLPTDEALLLLTTGRRVEDLTFSGEVSDTLTAVGTVVGRSFVTTLSRSLEEEEGFFERLEFEVKRSRSSGLIGDIDVEYQLTEDAPWYLLFDRQEDETYRVQVAWRLWVD
ncbi:MAG: translocation/assembly module TamB domain-containing protein [Spirochaetota bacterium]